MDGVGDVFRWATGTLEGVALIEYIILVAIILMYRRNEKHEQASRDRHKEIDRRFAEGSTKFALIEQEIKHLRGDLGRGE